MNNKATQTEVLPFSYFMQNKDAVISKLEYELVRLKGVKYSCCDSQIPSIDQKIYNVQRAIRYNQLLK